MKKIYLGVVLVLFVVGLTGCGGPKPGKVVERFFGALEDGKIDEAVSYLSSRTIATLGEEKWRASLVEISREMTMAGESADVKVISETVNGDIARVEVELTDSSGFTDTETFDLIKEEGDWKIEIDPFIK